MHLSLLVRRFLPMKVIRVRNNDKLGLWVTAGVRSTSSRRLIFGGLVIALELTGITRGELIKFMPKLGFNLVSEACMF